VQEQAITTGTTTMKWMPLLLCGLILCQAPHLYGQDPPPHSSVIARINDAPIYQAELDREIEIIKQNRSTVITRNSQNIKETLRKEALDRLIALELLFQECRREGIAIDPVAVEKAYSERRQAYAEGNNPKHFEQALISRGSSVAQFRKAIVKELSVNKYIETIIAGKVRISETELRRLFEKHKTEYYEPEKATISNLSIRKKSGGEEDSLDRMAVVKAMIEKGESFERLAARYSENPNASDGGFVGTVHRGQGQLPPHLERAVFALEKGQTSAILETPSGYHLINVLDKAPRRYLSYAESRKAVYDRLKQQKIGKRVREMVEQRKRTATLILY
jgi:peptidyl-prolyl cis-trans isomerase SurA